MLPVKNLRTPGVRIRVGRPDPSAPPVLERPADRRVVRDPQEDLEGILEPFKRRLSYSSELDSPIHINHTVTFRCWKLSGSRIVLPLE
jgi:hypothetical protein